MKRLLMILVSALLAAGINGCGSSDPKSGTSAVTINLGETKTSFPSGKVLRASSIPTTVASVRFTISAPDMATIERTVSVAGRTSISESFDVPNGANRHFLVEVMDAAGSVIYRGDTYANLDGAAISIAIPMVTISDTTPPIFGGLVSATSTSSTDISLSWSAATDDVTPSSNIVYLIYQATASGGQNFAVPSYTTSPGATSFTATGLSPATTYYFVVRAKDEAGNVDANTVEVSATTLALPDTTPPIISSTSPPNNATGISIMSTVTVTFSEAMDPSTITDQTFTLSMPGEVGQVPVSGTVTYSGVTATFTPSALLFYETTYTATITTGAKDLAGNAIASPYTWNFTTASAPTTWAKTYGGTSSDFARSIQQTLDGGYIVAGSAYSFGADYYDFWVLKLNSDGSVAWQKTYSGAVVHSDYAYSIKQTSDGGYIVAGTTYSFGAGTYDFWVLKLAGDGTVQWQKTYGGTSDDWAESIQQTTDGGYIVAGYTYSFGAGIDDFWVLKLNPDGSAAWQKSYGGTNYDNLYFIQQTSDGGYVVVGGTSSFGAGIADFWVLKLNSDGSTAWQKTYGDTNEESAHYIQQTTDGGYIVAGWTSAGGGDLWVLKLNPDGSVVWQKTYGGTNADDISSIQQTSDGGYIVAGWTASFGAGNNDSWVLKLNPDGSAAWQKTYGGTSNEDWSSIQQTSDGGYIVAGATDSFGAGGADFWVLKLNSDGTINFNPGSGASSTDTNATVTDTTVTGADTTATVADTNAVITDTSATVTDTNATITQQAPRLGLYAQYSNGDILIEGPVFHGYWTDCTSTGNNLYQGVCTPVSSSPVDWAWGTGFSVTWTGYLYVPASGDYTFNSWYWVDGIVHIEVNGIVVADLNTTGAGYSKVITLQGGTWVPVYMAFSPNGGSNNMHLGWTPPGGTWAPVPKEYLAPSLP